MTPPPSFRFARSQRSHDLLVLAADRFPPLELGERTTRLYPDDVVHVIFIGLVVSVVFLAAPDGLLHPRMREAALDPHPHGLVLLVAHHDALERALRHF